MKNIFILSIGFLLLSNSLAAQVETHEGEGLIIGGKPIYAVQTDGILLWYKHTGAHYGGASWVNKGKPNKVGTEWSPSLRIFKGALNDNNGPIYRIDLAGDLYWYYHTGKEIGTNEWRTTRKIGNGWADTRQVFSGGDGVIYTTNTAGDLHWYKHLGYKTGTKSWANNGFAKKVGNAQGELLIGGGRAPGWRNYKFIFSGGYGIIYLIDPNGNLSWTKHLGFQDGTMKWSDRKIIGGGWQDFRFVFSGGKGIIYAITKDGSFYWYNHTGYSTGENTWENNGKPKVIGSGWDFKFVF